jgi:hypothetical protein
MAPDYAQTPIGPGPAGGPLRPQRLPGWLEATELFLRLFLQICLGLFFCFMPWLSNLPDFPPWSWFRPLWDQNPLFLKFPALSVIAANGAVRGMLTGLGILNILFAFHDAIRHGTDKE